MPGGFVPRFTPSPPEAQPAQPAASEAQAAPNVVAAGPPRVEPRPRRRSLGITTKTSIDDWDFSAERAISGLGLDGPDNRS